MPPDTSLDLLDSSSMFGIGPMELVLILVVALLVLGPKRMPQLARTLGRGLGEFRRASNDLRQSLALDDLQNDLREGLKGVSTTHTPSSDRPAQTGDTLARQEDTPQTPDPEAGGPSLDDDPHAETDSEGVPAEDAMTPRAAARADSNMGNVPVGDETPDATDDERG